jgi:predicted lipid-binding transport protein (Tim44 family)
MAKSKSPAPPRTQNRWLSLLGGMVLGFVWGTIMWGLVTLFGQETGGVRGWLIIAVTMGMIGGGVAAIFGAFGAVGRGERIGPRLRRSRKDAE